MNSVATAPAPETAPFGHLYADPRTRAELIALTRSTP